MFDPTDPHQNRHIVNSPAERVIDSMDRVDESASEPAAVHELDNEVNTALHALLRGYYRQELDRQEGNRRLQAKDQDYYDNIQWTEEDAAELRDRGQTPIVYNVIAQSVNWIIGTEKRGRTDFNILPTKKDDAKPAERKTKLLKYLSDVNRLPFHRSRAFEDATVVGIGWLEDGAQDDDDGEPVYSRYESWRNMLWDSAATEFDLSDARFVSRSKWVDLDIAKALFPERIDVLEKGSSTGSAYTLHHEDGDDAMDQSEEERDSGRHDGLILSNKRRRVRLIEMWYRVPEKVERLRGGAFNGQIYEPTDARHAEQVQTGQAALASRTMMRMRVAIFTSAGLLYDAVSPYRHNRFPFTPIWGYRAGRNGLPYGVVRGMVDIQDDVNKRMSKTQFILNSNKTIVEEGAVEDMDDLEKEVSRPNAMIVMKTGFMDRIKLSSERELAPAHLDLMSRNIQMIQQTGGVTDELLGRSTNAVSGVAVQARQEQGSIATNKLFDNLRLACQIQGENQLSLVEQYITEQKSFRITNQRGTPEFIDVNDGLPENDITRTKADFVISEADWRATMRQAALDQLTNMMSKMPPEIAMTIMDLVVDSMDLPNREEIVKRIRQVTGQKDPDATEPTPEDQAREQAQAEQAAQQQLMAEAQLQEQQGKADLAAANVAKVKQETERIQRQGVSESVTAAQNAFAAAQGIVLLPTAAKVADGILKESGWMQAVQSEGLPPLPAQVPQPAAQPDPMMEQAPQMPEQMMPPQDGAPVPGMDQQLPQGAM